MVNVPQVCTTCSYGSNLLLAIYKIITNPVAVLQNSHFEDKQVQHGLLAKNAKFTFQ